MGHAKCDGMITGQRDSGCYSGLLLLTFFVSSATWVGERVPGKFT
jgi:hypothetical protein